MSSSGRPNSPFGLTKGEVTMTRKKLILVAGTCAMAVAIGSPAYALNPQPLPPGRTATPAHIYCANGNHYQH
jgi:hypothetical protein